MRVLFLYVLEFGLDAVVHKFSLAQLDNSRWTPTRCLAVLKVLKKKLEKIFERFFLGKHVLKMLQFGLQNEESYDAHGGFHSVENPFRIFWKTTNTRIFRRD